jgi:hypothetical protein
MNNEHYIAVGHVSDAARQALLEADCFVHDLSPEPPLVAVGIRYQGKDDLSFTWSVDAEIQVNSSGLYLIWRSTTNVQPLYASVLDTELLTYEEWCAQIDQATVARLADQGWDGELGELDNLPF